MIYKIIIVWTALKEALNLVFFRDLRTHVSMKEVHPSSYDDILNIIHFEEAHMHRHTYMKK